MCPLVVNGLTQARRGALCTDSKYYEHSFIFYFLFCPLGSYSVLMEIPLGYNIPLFLVFGAWIK